MTDGTGVLPRSGPTGDQVKRQVRGWNTYWWASHTFETSVTTVFMSRYLPAIAKKSVGTNGRIHLLGIPIAPGSLFAYVLTTCAILLVFTMPIVGALADRTGRKRAMLHSFGAIAALSCIAMVAVGSTDWILATVLLIIAYLSYTYAKIVCNSLLPDLAAPEQRDRVSSVGWAYGYIGGGIVLAASFVASFFITDSATLARVGLCAAGCWWAAFMVLSYRWLAHLPDSATSRARIAGTAVTAGFRQLAATLRELRTYPMTLLFLLAYLVYYDGINTVVTLSADYGQNALKLSDNTLLTAILIVQFAAFGGALLLYRIAVRFGAKRVIAVSLLVWIFIVVAAYFLQAGSAVQFFALAMLLSIVMGGTQALSRSLFAQMIPHGREGAYFGFYEISSSGTSAIGPLIYGVALQTTHSYRIAIFSLVIFFVLGLAILIPVNVRKAIVAAGNTPPATLL
ncbi:MAG: MFS transporter [Sciscionella sp.]